MTLANRLYKLLALDKLATLRRIISQHGGAWGSIKHLYLTDDLKEGTLVGEDKYGNRYYENNNYCIGKNRWVIYNKNHHLDYDGSMIPPEWFGWIHYKTDFPPTVRPPVHYKWMTDHSPNPSGTYSAYVPYSTTRPKIQSWRPGQKKKEERKQEGEEEGKERQQ